MIVALRKVARLKPQLPVPKVTPLPAGFFGYSLDLLGHVYYDERQQTITLFLRAVSL